MFVHRFSGKLRLLTLAITLGLSLALALPLTASAHTRHDDKSFFKETDLATDATDTNLINAWGIVAVPDGPFWIVGNNASVATAYDGKGRNLHSVIQIGTDEGPTGVVLNRADADDFVISNLKNGKSAPARLLFATESGKIFGWNKRVDPNAIQAFPLPGQSTGAVYKGLAQGRVRSRDFLYATDFLNGKVDVFDAHFNLQPAAQFPFSDPSIPAGFGPFGIRNIEGKLVVTYAKRLPPPHEDDDEAGVGNGFVDVFDTSGNLLRQLVAHDELDSPWGLALAPRHFGKFSHALLVGNFGHVSNTEPSILAFDFRTGKPLGPLTDKDGNPIHIEGLWGLTFGDDARAVANPDDLYFAAGPGDEQHGLFGKLTRKD